MEFYSLSPALAPGVVEHKLVVCGAEALVEVADGLVGGGGEGLVDVQEEGVALLELEIFPDELYDPADLLLPVHLVILLFHDRSISRCLQSDLHLPRLGRRSLFLLSWILALFSFVCFPHLSLPVHPYGMAHSLVEVNQAIKA